MPPQPITRITPNPAVDFDPAKLASIPHLTALPMTVIAIWGAIDGNLAKMLSHIVESDFGIGHAANESPCPCAGDRRQRVQGSRVERAKRSRRVTISTSPLSTGPHDPFPAFEKVRSQVCQSSAGNKALQIALRNVSGTADPSFYLHVVRKSACFLPPVHVSRVVHAGR
jgi:hypothetical protein